LIFLKASKDKSPDQEVTSEAGRSKFFLDVLSFSIGRPEFDGSMRTSSELKEPLVTNLETILSLVKDFLMFVQNCPGVSA